MMEIATPSWRLDRNKNRVYDQLSIEPATFSTKSRPGESWWGRYARAQEAHMDTVFELFFQACMLADPTSCRDVTLTFQGQVPGVIECSIKGQTYARMWVEQHSPREDEAGNPIPAWRTKKYVCRPVQGLKSPGGIGI